MVTDLSELFVVVICDGHIFIRAVHRSYVMITDLLELFIVVICDGHRPIRAVDRSYM